MHHTNDCPIAAKFSDDSTEQVNVAFSHPGNDPYSNTYNPGWRNHPHFSWKAQASSSNVETSERDQSESGLSESIVNSHSQSIAKLKGQMGKMANTLNKREERTLPSQPVANPKGHYMVEGGTSQHQQVLAITTLRSGRRVYNHVQEKEDEQSATPQNLQKEKGKQKRTEASSSFAPTPEMPYEPRAPFPECLEVPSHFGKQGEKIQDIMEVFKQHSLPPKFKDPGAPTISCIIEDHKIDKALLDLGAGVTLLPYSKPRGIIVDVIIQVDNFYFPVNFIVLDTEPVANPTKMIPVILGLPFLATANANINCRTGMMKIRFGNLKVKLSIFYTFQQPPDKVECFFLDSIENLVAKPPPCILTIDPFAVGMTHIKVDNCDTGQSIAQANYWLLTTAKLDVPPLAISRTSRLLLPGNILSWWSKKVHNKVTKGNDCSPT
ncbi:uncharacterized protein LOC133873275 [Alnus glutinosa]|uniref:uncharacterized protein LOC133873275 n=1 Tax=Alnus glutinosa TaxID=3517 RepID=UPI002D78AF43|nr:uncharacterized protein LOC133873275 [Alnus glutinosa]